MLEWFLNPGYLAAAAALISLPIIIHLINRMRFKRVRWAAMEFLLKAQKRSRKRLIVEQLLLLALRCLLVALVGFLVMRFVGFSFSDFASKQGMHVIVVDDTLSQNDAWAENGVRRTSFDVARTDIVENTIVKALGKVNSSDKVLLIPVTKAALDPDFQPKAYEKLSDPGKAKEFKKELDDMEPTQIHASILPALKKVQEIMANNPEARVTLHVVSDFRQRDWALPEGEGLHQAIQGMAKGSRDFKAKMIDVAHPFYTKGQANPLAHDNIGILDFRAATRVVGKGMKVNFTVTIANFSGREVEPKLAIYEVPQPGVGGEPRPMFEIQDFPMAVKISPLSTRTVNFEVPFNPTLKPGEPYFARLLAELRSVSLGELENDGLKEDNSRFATVEVREKVPVLIIDGEGLRGRTEFDKDSFFLQMAFMSVTGASYELVWGDELGGGSAVRALERPDLAKFPTIFLTNVRELTDKQRTNLEAFVRDGGGVCFFMGPQVSSKFYNEKLYQDGAGLFPVPLNQTYTPPPTEEPRKVEYTGYPQVILRDEQFGDNYPIFGAVFNKDSKQRNVLKDLPVKRYFQVPRANWKPEAGKVFELATLANESPIANFQGAAVDLVRTRLDRVLESPETAPYRARLAKHRLDIERLVQPGSEKLAYHLAPALDAMINDRGDTKHPADFPDLTVFWNSADAKITSLREDILKLRDQVKFGDPFVVAGTFGKGKVVAVMTTAGKDWSDWCGGSESTLIYQPFIAETQNYISSQSVDDNRTVGGVDRITLEAEPFKGKQPQAKREFMTSSATAAPEERVIAEQAFPTEVKGQLIWEFPKNNKPGLYVTTIRDNPQAAKPVASYGRVFNVDTAKEGPLERVGRGEIESNVIGNFGKQIQFEGPSLQEGDLVERHSDFSESPWLFLIFLFVLVIEQALAVHLSFHLKGNETDMLRQISRGS